MNSNNDFSSYTVTVDFDGLKLPLPNIYRYITRDESGFIHAWINKPVMNAQFGDFSGCGEMPITLGHQKITDKHKPLMRKYRKQSNNRLINAFGIPEEYSTKC